MNKNTTKKLDLTVMKAPQPYMHMVFPKTLNTFRVFDFPVEGQIISQMVQ